MFITFANCLLHVCELTRDVCELTRDICQLTRDVCELTRYVCETTIGETTGYNFNIPRQPTGIWPSSVLGGEGNLNLAWLECGIWTGSVKIIQLVEVQSSLFGSFHVITVGVPTYSLLLKCQCTRKVYTDTSLFIHYERNLLLKQLHCYMNQYL